MIVWHVISVAIVVISLLNYIPALQIFNNNSNDSQQFSNSSSGTLHDVSSDKIAWFSHRIKRGSGANWDGTSAGAEETDIKADGFKVRQIVMDHDTSAGLFSWRYE